MYAMNPQPLQARPFVDSASPTYPPPQLADSPDVRNESTSDVGESTRTGELTMSFEGEVYVFPAVTPQKVQFFPFD